MKGEVKWEDSIWLSVSAKACLHILKMTHTGLLKGNGRQIIFPFSYDMVIVGDLLSVCRRVSLWFSFGAFCGAFYIELCVFCFGLSKHNFFLTISRRKHIPYWYLEASGIWRKHKGTVILVNILESQMLTVYLQTVSQHRLVKNTLLGLNPSISDLASQDRGPKMGVLILTSSQVILTLMLWAPLFNSLCIVC